MPWRKVVIFSLKWDKVCHPFSPMIEDRAINPLLACQRHTDDSHFFFFSVQFLIRIQHEKWITNRTTKATVNSIHTAAIFSFKSKAWVATCCKWVCRCCASLLHKQVTQAAAGLCHLCFTLISKWSPCAENPLVRWFSNSTYDNKNKSKLYLLWTA